MHSVCNVKCYRLVPSSKLSFLHPRFVNIFVIVGGVAEASHNTAHKLFQDDQ